VEIVNYPALQSAKVRQHVLAKGEYDAILLVYDVSDRRSFERIRDFHAEVSLASSNGSNNHYHRKTQRSYAPRRHSGTPTRSSMQRRNSVMSFFSPGGPEEDVEAGKAPDGGGVVVALVGNKADIGDEDCGGSSEGSGAEDELSGREDDFDDDCESALAVFGDALDRDPHNEVKLGASLGITTSRPKPSHAESSETVERWLQVVGKATEDEREAASLESAMNPEVPLGKARPRRSVSTAEGEDLSRSLELQVPFLETSARTGLNVEEAFEAVVRSVLQRMGRSATAPTAELAKRCRQRHEAEQQKKRASVNRSSRSVDRLTAHGAGLVRGAENHGGRLVVETKLDGRRGGAAHTQERVPASVRDVGHDGRETTPRRERFMDRLRRILTPEEAPRGGGGHARGSGDADGHPTRSL
jgi:hypothetical protein